MGYMREGGGRGWGVRGGMGVRWGGGGVRIGLGVRWGGKGGYVGAGRGGTLGREGGGVRWGGGGVVVDVRRWSKMLFLGFLENYYKMAAPG